MNNRNNNVYILYAGEDETVKGVVDSIKIHLKQEHDITPFDYQDKEKVDDPEEEKIHKRMSTLLEAISNGSVIILNLDRHYLGSIYCLAEIHQIVSDSGTDLVDRMVLVVYDDDIFNSLYNKEKQKNLLNIVANTIQTYLDKNDLDEDTKIIIRDKYRNSCKTFLDEILDIRYSATQYTNENINEIKKRVARKTEGLAEYLKKIRDERKKILDGAEASVSGKKIMMNMILPLLFIILMAIFIKFSYFKRTISEEENKTRETIRKSNSYLTNGQDDIIASSNTNTAKIIHEIRKTNKPPNKTQEKELWVLEKKNFSREIRFKIKKAENLINKSKYKQARKVYKNLLKEKVRLSTNNMIEIYRQIANIDKNTKDWEKFEISHNDYISFFESEQNETNRLDLIHAYRKSGKVYYYKGDYSRAREWFLKSQKGYKDYYQLPHEHSLWTNNWIGDTFEKEDNYKDENKTLSKSLVLALKLNKINAIKHRKNIPWIYSHLAYAQEKLGDINSSIENYKNAIKWYDRPTIDTKYKKNKSWIYRNLGHIHKNKKVHTKALNYYKLALKRYDKNEQYGYVAQMYWNIYDMYWRMGDKYINKMKQALLNSLNSYKKANKKEKTNKFDINIGRTYCDIGWFYCHKDANSTSKIIENYQKCIDMKKNLNPKQYLIDVVWSQRDLADYYFGKEQYKEAELMYKKALKDIEIVINEYNQTQYAKELAWTYHDIGASIDGQDGTEFSGKPFFEKALKVYEKYHLEKLDGYRLTLSALQYIYQEKKDFTGIEQTAKKLLAYYESRDKNTTWDKAYQNFLIGNMKLAKEKQEAIDYFDKSLEILDKIKDKDKSYEDFILNIILKKVSYYAIFNDKEKAKISLKELEKYLNKKGVKEYYQYVSKYLDGKINADDIKTIMSNSEEHMIMYSVDHMFKAETSIKEKKYKIAKEHYHYAYKYALRGFRKKPDIYIDFLVEYVAYMVKIFPYDTWDKELDTMIQALEENGFSSSVQMATLKLAKAGYLIDHLPPNKEIPILLNEAESIYKHNDKIKDVRRKLCYVYYNYGKYYIDKENKKSEEWLHKALSCAKEQKNDNLTLQVYQLLETLFKKQGLYDVALKYQTELINLWTKYRLKKTKEEYTYKITSFYNEFINLHIKNLDFENFKKAYHELETISQDIIKKWPEELIMRVDGCIKRFEETKQYKEGIDFLEMILNKHSLESYNLERYQMKLAHLYEKTYNISQAKVYYKRAMDINKKIMREYKKENFSKCKVEELTLKIEDLSRCINNMSICNIRKYQVVYDENGDCKLLSEKEWQKMLEMEATNEMFDKYGTEANETFIDAVEPI